MPSLSKVSEVDAGQLFGNRLGARVANRAGSAASIERAPPSGCPAIAQRLCLSDPSIREASSKTRPTRSNRSASSGLRYSLLFAGAKRSVPRCQSRMQQLGWWRRRALRSYGPRTTTAPNAAGFPPALQSLPEPRAYPAAPDREWNLNPSSPYGNHTTPSGPSPIAATAARPRLGRFMINTSGARHATATAMVETISI